MKSIDLKCAEVGHAICDNSNSHLQDKTKVENMITKTLGVLQEDGVYSALLYLSSLGKNDKLKGPNGDKKAAMAIREDCFELMKTFAGDLLKEETDPLAAVRTKLATDLEQLLFAKESLERALVYARYHAKALPDKKKEGK